VILGWCRRRKEKKEIENGLAGEYGPRGFWVFLKNALYFLAFE
jgi:hypothetical protein